MQNRKEKILNLINQRQFQLHYEHEREYLATLIDSMFQREVNKLKHTNKVQEHFSRVFKNDIPEEDFQDLKKVVGKWLSEKLIKQVDLDLIKNAKR